MSMTPWCVYDCVSILRCLQLNGNSIFSVRTFNMCYRVYQGTCFWIGAYDFPSPSYSGVTFYVFDSMVCVWLCVSTSTTPTQWGLNLLTSNLQNVFSSVPGKCFLWLVSGFLFLGVPVKNFLVSVWFRVRTNTYMDIWRSNSKTSWVLFDLTSDSCSPWKTTYTTYRICHIST
jgi:hypothetical protein